MSQSSIFEVRGGLSFSRWTDRISRGQDRVITRQHETNRRIRYYRGFCESGRQTDVAGRTDGQTASARAQRNEELLRGVYGYGEGSLERAWPRAITGPCQPRHYPQLSVCVLRLGFSGPLRASEARESHREASRPKRKPPKETGDKEWREGGGGEKKEKKVVRIYRADLLYGVWRQTQIDPARFGFLGCTLPRELHDRKACDQFAVKGWCMVISTTADRIPPMQSRWKKVEW